MILIVIIDSPPTWELQWDEKLFEWPSFKSQWIMTTVEERIVAINLDGFTQEMISYNLKTNQKSYPE
jgi:hypothetical protein